MKKILLIEDDVFISELYKIVFVKQGFEWISAPNGEVGLQKIKTEKPDMILLDIMMPTVNGIDVLKQLKKDDALKQIPVIMLTNLADPVVENEVMQLGALKYVIKSQYVPDEVVKLVSELLFTLDSYKQASKQSPMQ
jgi:two-component system, OmpR family, alkaline phosphatase synthesis response regulator PhoP